MLWKFAPETLWLLPGLWQVLVGLGMFASVALAAAQRRVGRRLVFRRRLRRARFSAAPDHMLSPWTMGLPFVIGQLLMAALLYIASEDTDAEALKPAATRRLPMTVSIASFTRRRGWAAHLADGASQGPVVCRSQAALRAHRRQSQPPSASAAGSGPRRSHQRLRRQPAAHDLPADQEPAASAFSTISPCSNNWCATRQKPRESEMPQANTTPNRKRRPPACESFPRKIFCKETL